MASSGAGQEVMCKPVSALPSPSLKYATHDELEERLIQYDDENSLHIDCNDDVDADDDDDDQLRDGTPDPNSAAAAAGAAAGAAVAAATAGGTSAKLSPSSLGSRSSCETLNTAVSTSSRGSSPTPKHEILCIDKKKSQSASSSSPFSSSSSSAITSMVKRLSRVSLSGGSKEASSKLNKASAPPGVDDERRATWKLVGDAETLRRTKCRRLYAKVGQAKDLAFFYKKGSFFAMEAWCSHMGGPLYEGDIEDYNGSPHVLCPWHAYMFDIASGCSDIGLRQQVFQVKTENGKVFINYSSELSLYPYL